MLIITKCKRNDSRGLHIVYVRLYTDLGVTVRTGRIAFHATVASRKIALLCDCTRCCLLWWHFIKVANFSTLKPRQNGCHFADNIFKCICLDEDEIFIKISLKFTPMVLTKDKSALVQVMSWHRMNRQCISTWPSWNGTFWLKKMATSLQTTFLNAFP